MCSYQLSRVGIIKEQQKQQLTESQIYNTTNGE